jgi:folate-binding protein YgfZ
VVDFLFVSAVRALKILNERFLSLDGPDALRFLSGMVTSDVKKMALNAPSATQSFLLSPKGKIVSPLTILCLGSDRFMLSFPSDSYDVAIGFLDRYLVADEVTIQKLEGWQSAHIWGNESGPESSVPPSVPGARDRIVKALKTDNEDWLFPLGRLGSAHGLFWSRSLEEYSKNMVSDQDYFRLRWEGGVPEWGLDFGPESSVLDFPHQDEISFHKGCYVGQETVAMGTHRGKPVRAFCRIQADEGQILPLGYLYSGSDLNAILGKVTSVNENCGLGLVRTASLTTPGISWVLLTDGVQIPVRVSPVHE